MINLGDFATGSTVRIPWNTNGSNGASITRATDGTIKIYKDSSTTERSSSAGITDSEDFDGRTGLHVCAIDLSDNTDAGFYASGHDYFVVVAGAVVDGQTVNPCIGTFSIQNRYAAASGTAPTAAAVATAVWQDLLASSDFSTSASIGKLLKDDIDAAISSRMATFILPSNFSSLAIDANGRTKSLVDVQKNVALPNFTFLMTDASSHLPMTGLVNGDFTLKKVRLDSGSAASLSGTITEVDSTNLPGIYQISLTSGEVNGKVATLFFRATGADDRAVTVVTSD